MGEGKKKEPGKALERENENKSFVCMNKYSRNLVTITISGGIIGRPGFLSRVLKQEAR